MPSIMFNGRPGQDFTLVLGGQTHFFRAGEQVPVSREVALRCHELTDKRGQPAFRVWGLDGKNPDADVEQLLGIQLEWDKWR